MSISNLLLTATIATAVGIGWLIGDRRVVEVPVPDEVVVESLNNEIDSLKAVLSVRPRDLKVERDSLVVRLAREAGINPKIALGIAWVENPWADSLITSHAGALGLMQVMPPAALEARGEFAGAEQRRALIERLCGDVDKLAERACNVRVGLAIYADYFNTHGTEYHALAAYNGALRLPAAAERYVLAVWRQAGRVLDPI